MAHVEAITKEKLAENCLMAARRNPYHLDTLLWSVRFQRMTGDPVVDPIGFLSSLIDIMVAQVEQSDRLHNPLGTMKIMQACYSGCELPNRGCRSRDFGDGVHVHHVGNGQWLLTSDQTIYATRPIAEKAALKAVALQQVRNELGPEMAGPRVENVTISAADATPAAQEQLGTTGPEITPWPRKKRS